MKHRFAEAAIILVLGFVLTEIVLQTISLGSRVFYRRDVIEPTRSDTIRILCVGDSHTYGAPMPLDQSYPSQLQAALAGSYPLHSFNVVNYGFPGMNSAAVANRLERQVLQLRPDLVIVWVGANNMWNEVETEAWGAAGFWTSLRRVFVRSRLFRLGMIAWVNHTGKQYDPDYVAAPRAPFGEELERKTPLQLSSPVLQRWLRFDVERMIDIAHSHETPIMFVTYPTPHYGWGGWGGKDRQWGWGASIAIKAGAFPHGVPVIDSASDLERAMKDGYKNEELIDIRIGPHPTGLLYGYVVESMLPHVVEILKEWHSIELRTDGIERVGAAEVEPSATRE